MWKKCSFHRLSKISQQFFLLVYKNFILQFRRPIGTIIELFLPVIAVVFVIVLRRFLIFENENKCFTTFEPDPLVLSEQPGIQSLKEALLIISYSPKSPDTDAIMSTVNDSLFKFVEGNLEVKSFNSENEVVDSLLAVEKSSARYKACFNSKGIGIIFNNLESNKLSYTIRLSHEAGRSNSWRTSQTTPSFETPGSRTTNLYLSEGFLHVQKYVGNAIIKWRVQKDNLSYFDVNASVQKFPHPEYSVDEFLSKINIILPIIFVLTFLYSAGIIVKELVLEKETRMRESMLMMGLTMWILWASWFFKQLVFLLPSAIVVTCLIKFTLFQNSDGSLLFIFIVLYVISMISFSFLVSVWFNSARLGILFGFISWFGSFCPFLFLVFRYREISFAYIFISCLLSNTAFGFGVEIIARLEQQTVGITWSNVFQPITADDSFNMPWVFGMLLMDSLLYLTVTWYVSEVRPGMYGVPKPLYFLFLPSYWCGTRQPLKLHLSKTMDINPDDPSAHERVRGKPPVGISIRNLTKIYSSWLGGNKGVRKKAVDNLSLDAFKGQITVLLGHNGAGKTTTMSVLVGLLTPTEGNVIINGYSILSDMESIRESLGICPQHNVLFDRLTVKEHLKFFMWLKGIHNRKRVKSEVNEMIDDLLLSGKSGVQASHLSGGMKRKLSVGIALIGGSELVILDEPTAGMDPYARRATWDLLGKYKENRCIFMSTHLMDEADLLGDRIAIMAEGKLRCSGSSLFLKSRYGVGYHLTLIKNHLCVSSIVESFVTSFVPSAKKITDVGMELSFILPSTEVSKFSNLFDEFESNKGALGIDGFGISITTMEEVFLKVGQDTENALKSIMKKKRSIALETTKLIRKRAKRPPENSMNRRKSKPEVRFKIDENSTSSKSLSSISSAFQDIGIQGSYKQAELHTLDRYGYSGKETDVLTTTIGVSGKMDSKVLSSDDCSGSSKVCTNVTSKSLSRVTDNKSKHVRMNLSNSTLCDLYGKIRTKNKVILPPISKRNSVIAIVKTDYPLPPIFTSEKDGPMRRENEYYDTTDNGKITCEYNLNKGITLWLQQFKALLVKRFYYYIRFYPSLIIQLLFPSLFVSLGLLIILTFPNSDDPPRVLDLSTAALQNKDTTVFYAELDGRTMNLSEFKAKDFAIGNYINIRENILELRDSVENITKVDDCCNYKYQFLDKFCASRNAYELEHCERVSSSFGYSRCITCLRCCYAFKKERSCSSFYTWARSEEQPCPNPPLVSLHSNTSGPLDTVNTYVNEYILRLASRIGFFRFFRTYQAGFTVSSQTPIVSACDCERMDGKSVRGCSVFDTLYSSDCKSSPCPMLERQSPYYCKVKPYNETICRQEPSCFTVDEYSKDFLTFINCVREEGCRVKNPVTGFLGSNRRSIARVYPEYIPGTAVTVWYNNEGYHIPAAAFNAFQNIHLKQATKNSNLSLAVTNHPLPRNSEMVAQNVLEDFSGFGLSILSLFGYSFFLANFVVFLVKEKESKAKLLQFVSGVSVTSYWLSSLVWDVLNSFIPIGLSIIIFRVFPIDAYHGSNLISIFLVLVLTCWAAIPMAYIFSFLFTTSLAAFSSLLILFFFISVLFLTAIFLIQLFGNENKAEITENLHTIFLLAPTYGLAASISDLFINKQVRDFCMQQNESVCNFLNLSYVDDTLIWERPGVGISCIYLFIEGCAFMVITILLELNCLVPTIKHFMLRIYKKSDMEIVPQGLGEDEDVYIEKRRVLTGDADNDEIVIRNLVKVFNQNRISCSNNPPKIAVDGISLGIGKGECFGLLGVNGAGKTTTFSILTGDISMTSGTAIIANNDIRTSLKSARQGLGYCPQFDALIECMTARECLWMYARLRGVKESFIEHAVNTEIKRLDLHQYADKKCGTYSGGVKRKLSTAIAMIGNPPIILLDEPTNGMDPNTRRYLWDVLTKVTHEGKSIILTSHSMEECEALCTRLAIMVNGQFKCLGSIQHLKNKYGSGITLQVKIKPKPKKQKPDLKVRKRFLSMPATTPDILKGSLFSRRYSRVSIRRPSRIMNWYHKLRRSSVISAASTKMSTDTAYDTNALHFFIRSNFDGAMMLEEHVGAVTYFLPIDTVSWSSIFKRLEEEKEQLGIIDYSVSQTTLEQVFINFAKEQHDET